MFEMFQSVAFNFNAPHHHIYSNNKNHVIIGCNESQATDIGFSCSKEVIGKPVDALYSTRESDMYVANNEEVLRSGEARFFEEFAVVDGGEIITYLTYKLPVKDDKNKITGIMGMTVPLKPIPPQSTNTEIPPELACLTPQQFNCFNLIIKGWTAKEIAQKMKLSPRTVEHYVANIRMKLECKSLRELVVRYANKLPWPINPSS